MLRQKISSIAISVFITTLSTASFANSPYTLVTTQCLLKNTSGQFQTKATLKDIALVQTNEEGFQQLLQAKIKNKNCGGFMNVTQAWQKNSISKHPQRTVSFLQRYVSPITTKQSSYTIQHQQQVEQLIRTLTPENLWTYLTALSTFPDRYANSETGVKAAGWLKNQVLAMAKNNNRDDVTAFFVPTGNYYQQPSLVIKIGNSDAPGIVIGAHMDTLPKFIGNMPGADDDGSGSITVLETARALLSSDLRFHKPIYLVWYAAEEMGLVGSQFVVEAFKNKNIPIENVIHFDMTGYANKNDMTMWLLDDYTNPGLTKFLNDLIETYVKRPVKHTKCGYACSDHATWNTNGYPAAMAFEAEFNHDNPYIHSTQDVIANLNLEHMTDFAKLSLAFAVELADPIS